MAELVRFAQVKILPSLLLKKLVNAEFKLVQLTEEHHLSSHMSAGKKKDWQKCWHPHCVEARVALGDDIKQYQINKASIEAREKRNIRKAEAVRKRKIAAKLKELKQLELDSIKAESELENGI